MSKIIQTAGRDRLGNFAPKFAHYNDDVLFGENWNDTGIDIKSRCIVTLVAIVSSGIYDSSLNYHMVNAKNNGVTQEEISSILTHIAFYIGWPKAWAAFNVATEIWKNEDADSSNEKIKHQNLMIFPIGEENKAYSNYFVGKSYLAPISNNQVSICNVTFEPRCRNNWHIHRASKGGGQILLCVAGEGYYQEWGKNPIKMLAGDVINIPQGVKHWHGAADNSWFSHLAIEVPGDNCINEWLEKVSDEEYKNICRRS